MYYIGRCIKRGMSWGYLVCMTMITAGAAGNIFDCMFYGMIFNNPPAPMVAEFVPWGTGYGQLMLGRVVDMFYFPLVEWNWPQWMPWIGGNHFVFFQPIFNIADASLSVSVIVLILFYARHLAISTSETEQELAETNEETDSSNPDQPTE
jgi:signal peptidase II